MPLRSTHGKDQRAIDAFKRIHSAVTDPGQETRPQTRPRPDPAKPPLRPPAPPMPTQAVPVPAVPTETVPDPWRADPDGLDPAGIDPDVLDPAVLGRTMSGAARPAGTMPAPAVRTRPPTSVIVATAVLAGLALLTLLVARLGFGPSAPAGQQLASKTASHPAGPHQAAPNTPTTAPAPPGMYEPKSTSRSGSTYVIQTSNFTVDVATTGGSCWVEAGPGPAGPFSFASTVPVGSHQSFPAVGGAIWISLGAPNHVSVTIDGVPVQFDPTVAAPYELSFTSSA